VRTYLSARNTAGPVLLQLASHFCRWLAALLSFGLVSTALCYRCLDFLRAQSPPADLFFTTDFPLSFRITA
jgi:hypothetical protein